MASSRTVPKDVLRWIRVKDGPDPQFESKAALDDYCTKLSREYPSECAYLSSAK